jgi:hypothetical protein
VSGAGRPCTICRHLDRDEIDQQLIASTALKPISERLGVTVQALIRHRNLHLPQAVRDAAEGTRAAAERERGGDLLAAARALHGKALDLMRQAERARDLRTALAGIREAARCVELQGRLMGQIRETTQTVNVTVSAEWLSVQAVILSALEAHPEARQAVAEALETVS